MSFGLFLYPVHPNQKSNVRSFVSLVSREFGLIYLNLRLIYKVVMSFYLREFGLIFSGKSIHIFLWINRLIHVSLVSLFSLFYVSLVSFLREFGLITYTCIYLYLKTLY